MEEEKEFNVINVIPFIDIMLVLLTIVLTTSTFIARGAIPLDLPKASPSQKDAVKTHTIDIDRAGNIFLDNRPVAREMLQKTIATCDRTVPILVRADRELHLQAFVEVLDHVNCAGFKKVSLQTEAVHEPGRAGR